MCCVMLVHTIAIDFLINLKHMTSYETCKNYVCQHLINNMVSIVKWDLCLVERSIVDSSIHIGHK